MVLQHIQNSDFDEDSEDIAWLISFVETFENSYKFKQTKHKTKTPQKKKFRGGGADENPDAFKQWLFYL